MVTKESFQRYLDSFNNRLYDNLVPYYAADVEVSLPGITLKGPQAIVSFYKDFHQYVREHVEAKYLVIDETGIAVEMYSEFECFRDFAKEGLSFKKGEVRKLLNFVHYDLENDKFKRIRVARYKQY